MGKYFNNKLDTDIDQSEAYSRRDTVRVFGLQEQENENYATIRQYVIYEILSVASLVVERYCENTQSG